MPDYRNPPPAETPRAELRKRPALRRCSSQISSAHRGRRNGHSSSDRMFRRPAAKPDRRGTLNARSSQPPLRAMTTLELRLTFIHQGGIVRHSDRAVLRRAPEPYRPGAPSRCRATCTASAGCDAMISATARTCAGSSPGAMTSDQADFIRPGAPTSARGCPSGQPA
jgi:hypothetical protein